jgi:hypothetical protein
MCNGSVVVVVVVVWKCVSNEAVRQNILQNSWACEVTL